MKLNKVSFPIIFVLAVSLIAIWKLNESYRQDFMVQQSRLTEQQSTSLINSVSGYLSQLKNILSSFENGIVDSQINWQQIKPFFILARAEVRDKKITIEELYAHSDSVGKSWNAAFLTQALSFFNFPDHEIATKLFKNKSNQKFMALVFSDRVGRSKDSNSRALVLVAEAEVFQKFFNFSQGQNMIYSLLTTDQIVAAHSQPSYVATVSQERKNKNSAGLFLSEVVRGTDLTLISYSTAKAEQKFLVMPLSVLGIIVGACFVLVGVLAYAYIPIENYLRDQRQKNREEQYSKTLKESKESLGLAHAESDSEDDLPPSPAENDLAFEDMEESAVLKEPVEVKTQTKSVAKTRNTEPTLSSKPAVTEKHERTAVTQTTTTQTAITIGETTSIGSAGFYEVTNLIEAALKKMHTVFREHKVNVHKNITGSAKIEVDPDRFVKALCNVLINSVDAIKGRERRDIEITFFEKQDQIFLTVKDSGLGIRDEDKEKIWQPFFTTKNKKSHKGLGLSESVSIARRYGFELSVKNHPTGGAVAEFVSQVGGMNPEAPMPAIPHLSTLSDAASRAEISDVEIDSILNLEDIEIKELQPTHFKLESVIVEEKPENKIEIVEDPEINISFKEKDIDMTPIQIRKPTRDRAGSD